MRYDCLQVSRRDTVLFELRPRMSPFYQPGDEPISGYRLIAHLGQGGFGDVWKATAPGGFEVALKVIRLDRKQGQREFRSLKLMKRVRHANLVPIMALWLKDEEGNVIDDEADPPTRTASPEEQTVAYEEVMAVEPEQEVREPAELIIAMGLGSSSLNDRLDECKDSGMEGIPGDELLCYMEDSARAIDYLNSATHDLGAGAVSIQHGDVKPHNILIVGGTAQVCDFGLARVMGAGTRTTSMPAMTVAYASPETLMHNQPSHSSDLYSLAITYVDLRTGALPFGSETLPGVTRAIVKGQLDLSRLTPAEQSVIRRATAFDPDKRYPSAVEMVKDLRAAIEEKKFAAAPASRKRKVAMAAVCGVVVLAGTLIWALVPFGRGENGTASGKNDARLDGEEDIKAAIDRGDRLMNNDNLEDAIVAYTKAIDHEFIDMHAPLAALAYLGRGECYRQADNLKAANADFIAAVNASSRAIETEQDDPVLFIRRGKANLMLEEYSDAVHDYNEALKFEKSALVYFGLGAAHFGAGHFDEAIDDFENGLKVVEEDSPLKAQLENYRSIAVDLLRENKSSAPGEDNQDGLERLKNDEPQPP